MTSATHPLITRCPKCGTAFRVTPGQLQSAKGAVRCGSCLNVFKAQEHLVEIKPKAAPLPNTAAPAEPSLPHEPNSDSSDASPAHAAGEGSPTPAPNPEESDELELSSTDAPSPTLTLARPNFSNSPEPEGETQTSTPASHSLSPINEDEDILISDDMEDSDEEEHKYAFDGYLDLDVKPVAEVSLFERKQRIEDDPAIKEADESWAEMLIDEEESASSPVAASRPLSEEELADAALEDIEDQAMPSDNNKAPAYAGLVFSLVDEPAKPAPTTSDELVLSEELARLPSHEGFAPPPSASTAVSDENPVEPAPEEIPNKRQLKTQPKIRAYDGSRSALLMNIMPAPIEFTSKRIRRWYQRKLWVTLSILGLLVLAAQIAWFKFDQLSRIEPYRTAYLFICPYLGCELPTLVDIRQIATSNLVVREHPTQAQALAVDVMIINNARFDQPFPDLVLVFSDLDDKLVASRRFTPADYLGGELVGMELMPQNQKVYITLDLVDPGPEAVNYRIYIPHH